MRKLVAGVVVALAGVAGSAGVAGAVSTSAADPQPWDTMCAHEWNALHPEASVGKVQTYLTSLYWRIVRLVEKRSDLDAGEADPAYWMLRAKEIQARSAFTFQRSDECGAPGWNPKPKP